MTCRYLMKKPIVHCVAYDKGVLVPVETRLKTFCESEEGFELCQYCKNVASKQNKINANVSKTTRTIECKISKPYLSEKRR